MSLLPTKPQPPTLGNWIKTLTGFGILWEFLQSKGFTELKPRHLNQDPLEIRFGQYRAHGERNTNPTCWQFEGIHNASLISEMSEKKSFDTNCESICDGDVLFTLEDYLMDGNEDLLTIDIDPELDNVLPGNSDSNNPDIPDESNENSSSNPLPDLVSQKHLKIEPALSCVACQISFVRGNQEKNKNSFFDEVSSKIYKKLNQIMPIVCHHRKISQVLFQTVSVEVGADWVYCKEQHQRDLHREALNLIIDEFITHWCTAINRHLAGKSSNMKYDLMFKRAREKYQKKLKKSARIP